MTEVAEKPQLTEKQLKAAAEIHISLDIKGLYRGWTKMWDGLTHLYQKGCIAIERKARNKMMAVNPSAPGKVLVGMPIGIILRNTARAANNTAVERSWWFLPRLAVGLALGAAAVLTAGLVVAPAVASGIAYVGSMVGLGLVTGGSAISLFGIPVLAAGSYVTTAAAAGSFGLTSLITTVATLPAVGTLAALVVPPAYNLAVLTTSSVVAAATAVLSTVPALVNLTVGPARARYKIAKSGIELTDEQMEAIRTEFDRQSPAAKYDRQLFASVRNGLAEMDDTKRKAIYISLKEEFDPAAAAGQPATATAAAAPAAAPKQNP